MTTMNEETAGQMLERLGADGMKWAEEFRLMAIKLGYSDMPADWLVGWFANAIEYGHMVKSKMEGARDKVAQLEHDVGYLVDASQRAIPFLRDEAWKYDDDGSNEPLETIRDIESAIAMLSQRGEVRHD